MKVEVKQPEEKTPFPKLMIGTTSQCIVLFRSPKTGVVVYQGKHYDYPLGFDSGAWDMEYFTDFNGSVTLSND